MNLCFFFRVRTFDRKFFKPFLLREKMLSRDEKLLSTFQKIKELNVNKMVENPEFVFPSSVSMAQLANLRNESIGNFFNAQYVCLISVYLLLPYLFLFIFCFKMGYFGDYYLCFCYIVFFYRIIINQKE